MIWLLCSEALVGMLLVAALSRPRGVSRPAVDVPALALRSKIHLVVSRPAGDLCSFTGETHYLPREGAGRDLPAATRFWRRPVAWVLHRLAGGVLFLMRQFAVRVLGAQWRERQN